mmetsp:Transcript_26692/g.37503  ORF Transcript_26692/g.37503 Transcript_26692/m.37503 type:complete len:663 (+) Transcript_26692:72-2060(+)
MASAAVMSPAVNGSMTSTVPKSVKDEDVVAEEEEDLYLEMKSLERQLEFVELQEEYLKDEMRHLERELLRAKEEIRRIQSVPLVIGQFNEMIDANYGIVSSTAGSNYLVRILSTLDRELLKPNTSIALHRHSHSVVDILPPESDSTVQLMSEKPNVTYKDIGGMDVQKQEVREAIELPLIQHHLYTQIGIDPPRGVLLYGPPGTGKTMMAKAVANATSATFISMVGSEFVQKYLGEGPRMVRDVFRLARENSPCIVFIDEIDAVGRKRGRGGVGGNDERENTLNQLLVEMDGFSPSTGVVVLAGTNRVDILDEALTRPGRFDRQVQVDKPDLMGRKEIFQVHLKGITLEGEINDYAGRLAGLTPGFAGADIANICNEAAIVAARRKAESVTMDDFEKATDRVIGGLESNKIMSKEERSIVAHHEAGHAVAGWFLEHADPLLKVTIIPRSSGALGYAQYLPKEVFLRTEEQIMDIVCMALAGRAAEEIFFGKVTTGASDDLRRVTDLVYSTIQLYGMNDRVGQLAFPKDPNAAPGDKPYSDATAEAMDEEARAIVDAAYERTLNLMKEKKAELEKVALCLLEKETITHDDIVDLIGARPFQGDDAYNEYVSRRGMMEKEEDPSLQNEEEAKEEGLSGGTGGLTPGLAFNSYNKNSSSVQRWTN